MGINTSDRSSSKATAFWSDHKFLRAYFRDFAMITSVRSAKKNENVTAKEEDAQANTNGNDSSNNTLTHFKLGPIPRISAYSHIHYLTHINVRSNTKILIRNFAVQKSTRNETSAKQRERNKAHNELVESRERPSVHSKWIPPTATMQWAWSNKVEGNWNKMWNEMNSWRWSSKMFFFCCDFDISE